MAEFRAQCSVKRTTRKATLVKEYEPGAHGILWKKYRCDPGGEFPQYVIASASDVCEVRIFPSTKTGKVKDFDNWLWTEEGTRDHEKAMAAAGYKCSPG